MVSRAKYQHYIPASHIRNFSTITPELLAQGRDAYYPTHARVLVTDHFRGIEYQAPVKRVGGENHLYEDHSLYTNEIEKLLTKKIDGRIGDFFFEASKVDEILWTDRMKETILKYVHTLPQRNANRVKTMTREELLTSINEEHNPDEVTIEIISSPFPLKLSLTEPVLVVGQNKLLPLDDKKLLHIKPYGTVTDMNMLLDAVQARQEETTHVWVSVLENERTITRRLP